MTVKQLIDALVALPPDCPVVRWDSYEAEWEPITFAEFERAAPDGPPAPVVVVGP